MSPPDDFARLIRCCVWFIAGTAAVYIIDAAAGTGSAAVIGLAALAVIALTARGRRACDELDALEADLPGRNVWVIPPALRDGVDRLHDDYDRGGVA